MTVVSTVSGGGGVDLTGGAKLMTFSEADKKVRDKANETKKPVPIRNCPLKECSLTHEWGSARSCEKFLKLSLKARREIATKNRLCYKCLCRNHTANQC